MITSSNKMKAKLRTNNPKGMNPKHKNRQIREERTNRLSNN